MSRVPRVYGKDYRERLRLINAKMCRKRRNISVSTLNLYAYSLQFFSLQPHLNQSGDDHFLPVINLELFQLIQKASNNSHGHMVDLGFKANFRLYPRPIVWNYIARGRECVKSASKMFYSPILAHRYGPNPGIFSLVLRAQGRRGHLTKQCNSRPNIRSSDDRYGSRLPCTVPGRKFPWSMLQPAKEHLLCGLSSLCSITLHYRAAYQHGYLTWRRIQIKALV